MNTPEVVWYASYHPDLPDSTALKGSEVYIFSIFCTKHALKKSSQRLWKAIFSAAKVAIDKVARNKGIARYTLAIRFLTSYMEKGESSVKLASDELL